MRTLLASHTFPSGQKLEILQGDITQERVDAIVNAANAHLMHGGGVAAAILREGGLSIQTESDAWIKKHGPVTHDKPAYTHAGQLPCKFVIHAVGPIWGAGDENSKLIAAIKGSLKVAEDLGLQSIAFPAISTGIFGFPKKQAADIFMQTFLEYFDQHPKSNLHSVRMTLFDNLTLQTFFNAFNLFFTPK